MTRICVFTGSSPGHRAEYRRAAALLGRELARRGVGLVYGGSHVGLMGVLADAALADGGTVVGVIPSSLVDKELAHTGLTELRVVGSMHERKAMMADLADAFVAMPGGWGTLDELFEILTWAQLGFHAKPCGLLNAAGYFDPLLAFISHSVAEGFVRGEYAEALAVDDEPGALLDRLASHRPPAIEKWMGRAAT